MLSLHEVKLNAYLFGTGFATAALGFTYWQRVYLPRWFHFFGASVGILTGASYGLIRSGWHIVENLDALGKEYEISRMMK